jgi:predicted Zn-dependent protease with MMP-like domain
MDPLPAADPSPDDIEELVVAALDGLPDAFRERLGSVAIVLEDEPSPEQLRSVRARGLFGLYQGVPRTAWGADNAAIASKITIFRGPLTRAYRTPAALRAGVEDVVRHEVAHHFGISDARLVELAAERRRDDGSGTRR